MKTLIATLALASIVATSAVAKTEKAFRADANSVTCGTDPDPGIRAALQRDCAGQYSAGSGGNGN